MQQPKSSITSLPSHRSKSTEPFLGLFSLSLTFTTGLPLSFSSQVFLELTGSNLVFFDLLASQAFDLLEELGDFVGHGGSRT